MEWAMFVKKLKKERVNDYIEKTKRIPEEFPEEPGAAKEAGLKNQLVFVDDDWVYIIMGADNIEDFIKKFIKIEDVKQWKNEAEPMIEEEKEVIYLKKIYDFKDTIKKLNL